jgi:hypothetical protein
MDRRIATELMSALLVSGALYSGAGQTAELNGHLGVGITILDSCRINTAGDSGHAAPDSQGPAGFSIRCTKGASYVLGVTHSTSSPQPGSSAVTIVTVDY